MADGARDIVGSGPATDDGARDSDGACLLSAPITPHEEDDAKRRGKARRGAAAVCVPARLR